MRAALFEHSMLERNMLWCNRFRPSAELGMRRRRRQVLLFRLEARRSQTADCLRKTVENRRLRRVGAYWARRYSAARLSNPPRQFGPGSFSSDPGEEVGRVVVPALRMRAQIAYGFFYAGLRLLGRCLTRPALKNIARKRRCPRHILGRCGFRQDAPRLFTQAYRKCVCRAH